LWLTAWGVMTLVMLFFQLFYSDLIVPLFNKQKPLEQGELRTAIETFAQRVGFGIRDIYVMDGSKRSSKANAYFTGFGPRKRIVLYDTLMEQLSTEQIVGVLAHEIGHYKHRHIPRQIIQSLVKTLIILFVFNQFIQSTALAEAAGCSQPSFHVNMMIFSMLLSPLMTFLSWGENALSRHYEWQADEFARVNGMGMAVSNALKLLSKNNLSNLTPHPIVVQAEYSHPPLLARVVHLEKPIETES